MVVLLFLLIALFGSALGTSSGGSGVTTVPAAPVPAPRPAVTQPGLAPAKGSCVTSRFYQGARPQGPLQTPCNARSRPKP
jgi:hypothetical protein